MSVLRQDVARAGGRSPKTAPQPGPHPRDVSTSPLIALSRRRSGRVTDVVLRILAVASGALVVTVIALIALFLLIRAVPSLQANQVNFFTSSEFSTSDAENLRFGIRDLLIVTMMSSIAALVLAVPAAMAIAIFLTEYAPSRLARPMSVVIDLLAAVPSIVFGLWGIFVLAPALEPVAVFLNNGLGWFPLFATGNVSINGGGTIFTASIVLAIMILPIVTAVAREAYARTPRSQMEAALSLGATRWEVVRMTVIPFGRSSTVAGSMLGLGRALGETIAILLILRASPLPATFSLFDGGYTFASKIASAAAEFSAPLPTGAYIAAGLTLFVLTFVVNVIARAVAGSKATS